MHGTIVVINVEIEEVIHIVIKTQEEVGSAWNIEDLAIEEVLQDLEVEGIKIFEVVHDNKHLVDMLLTNHKIVFQKDLWHK
jgi:biotin operon repressor